MRTKSKKFRTTLSPATLATLQRALLQVDEKHDVLVDMDGQVEQVDRGAPPIGTSPKIEQVQERDGIE